MNIFLQGLFCSFLILPSFLFSQEQLLTENYFDKNIGAEIRLSSAKKINKILKQDGIYLDHGSTTDQVKLYITKKGFQYLKKKNILFSWDKPVPPEIKMMDLKTYIAQKTNKADCLAPMSSYPSYETYEQILLDYTIEYPQLCKLLNIGTLQSGRSLLVLQISDSLEVGEKEPNFLYTASMHGDELAGYPMMLMLIDHLLCNYGTDPDITDLVNNVNIFINPLANPNGTYRGGNESVVESIRFNASFVDLNQNYPDPKLGDNPDSNPYQEETLFFMEFAKDQNIHLSCNIHSGTEVINYPWDTFEHLHADDEWWRYVSRAYADSVHVHAPEGYFDFRENGITNGFAWYELNGGRQDYMTFFNRSREFTLEISDVKKLNSDQLPDIWKWNKSALINYIEESRYGLTGTITDCITGLPIVAEVSIPSHDIDNSSVFSHENDGIYFRFLKEGTYDLVYSAPDYDPAFFTVDIEDKKQIIQNIELCPSPVSTIHISDLSSIEIKQINNNLHIYTPQTHKELYIQLSTVDGKNLMHQKVINSTVELPKNLRTGIYLVSIINDLDIKTVKLFLK